MDIFIAIVVTLLYAVPTLISLTLIYTSIRREGLLGKELPNTLLELLIALVPVFNIALLTVYFANNYGDYEIFKPKKD